MTPEQQLAVRPAFEQIIQRRFADYPQMDLALSEDGFQYRDDGVNQMWEGFLYGVEFMKDVAHELTWYEGTKKPSEYMEDLRKMRQYSKCFTGAYDKNEPVFVLRAQDATSKLALAQWLHSNKDRLGEHHPKFIAAKATLGTFVNWPNQKDPD